MKETPILYQARHAELRKGMGALTHDVPAIAFQALALPLVFVAAAALWLLRCRAQFRVGHLFYRDRAARHGALTRFGRRIKQAADPESALDSVVRTIADSLRLPYAAVELRLSDGWRPAAVYGEAPSEVSVFPLVFQRETVGLLLVGMRAPGQQLGPDDERLLADLARQAGPATHAVALRAGHWMLPGPITRGEGGDR